MLDHPDQDPQDELSNSSPNQLHGDYPPQQFDPSSYTPQQPPGGGEAYEQSMGMASMQQQQQQHLQFEQAHMGPALLHRHASSGPPYDQAMGPMIDPHDPMLDADPFGLSASMHYPTSYSSLDHQPPAPR